MDPTSSSSTEPNATAYGFLCELGDKDFGAAVARVTEALKVEGFGFMDPVAVLQMTSNVEVAKVAHEVKDRLQRVKASLAAPTTMPNQG